MTWIRKAYVMGIAVERTVRQDSHFTEGLPSLQGIIRVFEGPVLDQLCIEAAVSCEIDVFEEDSILGILDRNSRLSEVHIQPERLGKCGNNGEGENRQ